MSSFKLRPINLAEAPRAWASVHDMLLPAVEMTRGCWDMSSLLMAICRGDVLLWVGERDGEPCMALITQIVDYPGKRALSIPFMGGKGGFEWGDELLTCLEQHAADRECALIEAVGRRGLGPFLNERGYRNSYITFTKEL